MASFFSGGGRRPSAHLVVELLEERCLLSASLLPLKVHGRVAGALWDVYNASLRRGQAADGVSTGTANRVARDAAGRVGVRVTATNTTVVAADLARLGFRMTGADASRHLLEGFLPVAVLPQLQSLNDPALLGVLPLYRPITSAGLVNSQGDAVLEAARTRATSPPGVDGTGVTVGVLSDSYNDLGTAAADVASGDLPASLTFLRDDTSGVGEDEGRAMLQIVHDVAPGSPLAFATAEGGETVFAQNIRDLARPVAQGGAGAKVIVDDISYFAEPFYQDGVVAQAVDSVVTNSGVAYFSSAGNFDNQAYESPSVSFVGDAALARRLTNQIGGFTVPSSFYNFDPGNTNTDKLTFTIPTNSGVTLSFQWAQPFYTVNGVTTDLDIYLINHATGTLVADSVDDNIANQSPVEVFGFQNTGAAAQFDLVINKFSGSAPARLKFVNFGANSYGDTNFGPLFTHGSTITAHAGSANALAVAAVPYFRQRTPEGFTSQGPTTILFNPDGTRKNSAEVRAKPDVTAPDGVDTTFFPPGAGNDFEGNGFPNFFGTSAAAPHAAAVAALVRQANPSFTPAQVYARLKTTADPNVGGTPGNVNLVGAGLVDAYRAVVGNPAPAATSFADGFEAGVLDQKWEVYNAGAGQTQVVTGNGPATGTYHLTMDTLLAGSFAITSLSEAILHLNLTGLTGATLAFKEKEFNNDADNAMPATFAGHGNFDGVALSIDGSNWVRLLSLTGANSTADYQSQSFDLLVAASAAGLAIGADTRVKFQHYSATSSMVPNQGFAFDDVVLTASSLPTVTSTAVNENLAALAGNQRSRVNSVVLHFSRAVTLDAGAVSIAVHAGATGTVPTVGFNSADGGLTYVVTFSGAGVVAGSIADGRYDLTVDHTLVHDSANQSLAADLVLGFFRLFGDANGDGTVNTADQIAFRTAFGRSTGDAAYRAYLDYNADGTVNTFDQLQFRLRFGVTI